jgi:hypothetical protein
MNWSSLMALWSVSANVVVENLYSQADFEGMMYAIFDGIVSHRSYTKVDEGTPPTIDGINPATEVVELEVRWVDGTTTWVTVNDLKADNPIELAEYAIANNLDKKPLFKPWVRDALRSRDRMIKQLKTRYHKRTQKHGISLPKSVEQALEFDDRTRFWRDAIEKEMKNVMPAFEFRDDDRPPPGYTKINCHMIFDIKSDLTRKA